MSIFRVASTARAEGTRPHPRVGVWSSPVCSGLPVVDRVCRSVVRPCPGSAASSRGSTRSAARTGRGVAATDRRSTMDVRGTPGSAFRHGPSGTPRLRRPARPERVVPALRGCAPRPRARLRAGAAAPARGALRARRRTARDRPSRGRGRARRGRERGLVPRRGRGRAPAEPRRPLGLVARAAAAPRRRAGAGARRARRRRARVCVRDGGRGADAACGGPALADPDRAGRGAGDRLARRGAGPRRL